MTQTSATAQPHAVSHTPHSLAAFDFAFNGTLDPVQVQEIATAAFVGRGENLLLVGGPCTGKTVIAMEVRQQATALGLTSEYLYGCDAYFADGQLVSHGPGFMGSTENQHGLRSALLNCDVLLVDEAERWFESAPAAFMLLLGRRIELGKSNVLTTYSGSWRRLFSPEASLRRRSMMEFDDPAFLLGNKPEQRSEWGLMLARERYLPLPQLLALLGLDFTLPAIPGEQPEAVPSLISQPISAVGHRRGPSPFAKAPVWHMLYTGEKSYLEILRRRG